MSQSAQDVLQSILDDYGLGDLASWAWNGYLASGSPDMNTYQPELWSKIQKTPVFKAKYPAFQTLIDQGKGISVDAYRSYTSTVAELGHQYGIPPEMYGTPQAVANLLTKGVSASEANQRFQIAASAAYSAPAEVRAVLADQFGISGGGLTAYWLDPDKAEPMLQAQYTAAQVAGAAKIQGVQTDFATASRLAAQGETFNSALASFGTAKAIEGLQYAGGDAVTNDQTIGAAFGNQADKTAVTRAQKGRTAGFQGGGGVVDAATGVSGLGSTSR